MSPLQWGFLVGVPMSIVVTGAALAPLFTIRGTGGRHRRKL